jgi:hypothetical protein
MRRFIRQIYRRIPIVRELLEVKGAISRLHRDVDKLTRAYSHDFIYNELQRDERYADPLRLLRYQHQVCSQNGEDGVIREIFRRIGTTNRVFAEVGVGTGTENNTAFLLSEGWNGFWFDGDNNFLNALRGRQDLSDKCLKSKVSFVTKENIATLFEQLHVPKDFDLLSLDIDQNTYFLWEGLQEYRARVVVVEYNAAIPSDVDWKVNYRSDRVWDGSQNFGASLKAFENLGHSLGYSLVGCEAVGANAFFVLSSLVGNKFKAPYTAENHYEPPRYYLQSRQSQRSTILDRSTS